MRTLLAGERTLTQAPRLSYWLKVEVQNGSGTWLDLGAILGGDYTLGATWGEVVDTPVGSATIRIARVRGVYSLSPLMAASGLNVDDTGAYSPLLELGRLVRLSTATLAPGAAPVGTDYREVFSGRIDAVAWESDPITLSCSDLGAWLMDTQIELVDHQYGTTPTGTALETVIQSIVTDNPDGGPAVTLYTPTSPSFLVTSWLQGRVKVLEGIRQIALESTGWDVRYRYDASHVSRLTLFNPQRSRTTVDDGISSAEYRRLTRLSLSIANVRNAGAMSYVDGTTGVEGTVTSTSTSSIAKYRRRYFGLAGSESLKTSAEAQTVLDIVINDLSGAPAEQEADCWYLWFVQLYDRYTFSANGVHYDQDQTLAVVGYQHTVEGGKGSSVLTCTGRVVGAYAEWLRRVSVSPQAPSLNVTPTPGSTTWSIAWAGTGTVLLSIDGGAETSPAASPITVTLTASAHTYKFTASGTGAPVTQTITVPAVSTAPTGPTFSGLSIGSPNYAADTVAISWTGVNVPSGATYNVTIYEQTSITDPAIGNTASFVGVTSPYTYDTVADINAAGPRTKVFRATVQMVVGSTVVATSTQFDATFNSN